jgi:hypothetical protein
MQGLRDASWDPGRGLLPHGGRGRGASSAPQTLSPTLVPYTHFLNLVPPMQGLWDAAREGSSADVRRLLAEGADVDWSSPEKV